MIKNFHSKIMILLLLFALVFAISCGNSEEIVPNIEENKQEIQANIPEVEEYKAEEYKAEEYKAEEPVAEEPVAEEPVAEEPTAPKAEENDSSTAKTTGNLIQIDFNSDSDNYIRANYRVTEQLARLSYPIDAVGYTQEISGSIFIDEKGKPTSDSKIHIDLSSLKSDESRRDDYLSGNSLETNKFPDAYFLVKDLKNLDLTDLTSLAQSEIKFQMVGDLTIHGVTKSKIWDVVAQTELGSIKGNASMSFPFSDFGMKIPSLFFIISVEDNIQLELDFNISVSVDA
ncbi:MAG: YceI family protein [Dehalococcoidia bacterium]|nr:YceI family protein [Dehalococcoidia bacterium]